MLDALIKYVSFENIGLLFSQIVLFEDKRTSPLPQVVATSTTISSLGPSFAELKTTPHEEKQEDFPLNEQAIFTLFDEMEREELVNQEFENEEGADDPEEVFGAEDATVPDKAPAEGESATQGPQRKEKRRQ